jgi:protein-tyrosine-phosphatase
MSSPRLRVLFLCTGNSARSQLAEALLRHLSHNQIDACSAGTSPRSGVHPLAIDILRSRYGIDATALSPKGVEVFVNQRFDVVITVCDEAAEACPIFPNAAAQVHWNFADPAARPVAEQRRAFEHVAGELERRIRLWLALPEVRRTLAS